MTSDISGELPTERSDDAEEASPDAFVFTVIEGPDAGAVYTLDPASPARMLIGKSVTCTMRLTDSGVSRRHASIRPEGRIVVLADLGSTNGTRINNVAVREASLSGGEAIRVGKTVITVTRGAPSHVELTTDTSFGRMIGSSRAMRRLYPVLQRLAPIEAAILLEGEAGVGKELCAEELHAASPRASRPFVVVACQTLAPNAIEEHVFGAEGVLAQAQGGTVFIDEVAMLPPGLQRRFAIVLEKPEQLGARVIFATRRDLDRDVESGTFREELLNRLAPWRVEVPALRDRAGDVEVLARTFWAALVQSESRREIEDFQPEPPKELPVDFTSRFHRYRWPGNVRELAAAVAARFNMGELGRWRAPGAADQVDFIGGVVDRELPLTEARQSVIDEFERRYVAHMLNRHGNTRDAAAASAVGIRYFQILRARFQ